MNPRPLKVAWISYFPVEWLPDAPPEIRALPKRHPASWLQSGVEEMRRNPLIDLHVLEVSKVLPRSMTFRSDNVTFHCLKVPGGLRAPSLFWIDTLAIRRKLKKVAPDVVHAWGTEKGAALAASRLPYPYLVSVQGLMNYFAEILPVNRYMRLAAWFERSSLKRAKVASGESRFVVDYLRQRHAHLRVFHVEHTPTWSSFGLKRSPETDPIHFVAVGEMGYRKGTDLILLALDRLLGHLDFKLTLIGFHSDAALIENVRQRTSSALWEKVKLVRTATDAELRNYMSKATMVLFPTRGDTGPVAVKEAVVAGVPVIGSVMGGIPDYVTPDENGFLFPPGDLEKFTEAIAQAAKHPLFRKGMVDAERMASAREQLSPKLMAEQFASIYKELLGKPSCERLR
jgi:glycosyltransferase involved in cell wall biosynthesis